MQVDTLIIGYVPLQDVTGKKPREIRDDTYFKELIAEFDLGTVHYVTREDWKLKVDEVNPLIIISLGGDYYAQEVHQYKKDALLYAADSVGGVFSRKAEVEEKKAKHKKIFAEAAGMVQRIREGGEENAAYLRKFAGMSYKQLYDLIKQGLISDNKELHDSAWDLLFGEGDRHQNLVWMRINVLADVWEGADGKGREELMCMAMNQHVENGLARKLDVFTDADGQQFHQYMFCNFFGQDLNYIRRIPFGEKKQDKWAYESLLNKYETPANFIRVMLEAGQLKSQKEEHFKTEVEKVARVLTEWKSDPKKSKEELGVVPWDENDSTDDPLTERELESMKKFLQEHNPSAYEEVFINKA